MGHKSKKQVKKVILTNSESITIPSIKKEKKHHKKLVPNHCECEQKFYIPLPATDFRTTPEQLTPASWFAPGLVQSCSYQCSSVKPVYAQPCTGYCCRNNY